MTQPFPEAIPTTLGWAHPLTGEQLTRTKDLADPVDYYKPNARNASFIDPEGIVDGLIFARVRGKRVDAAVHIKDIADLESINWDFDGGAADIDGTVRNVRTVITAPGTYTITATVSFTALSALPDVVLTTDVTIA